MQVIDFVSKELIDFLLKMAIIVKHLFVKDPDGQAKPVREDV